MRILIALFMCAGFLPGCITIGASLPTQTTAETAVAETSRAEGQRDASGALQPQALYYTIGFNNWSCSAAGGTLGGEDCFGQFRQELPAYIPTDVLLCKTEITVHQLDTHVDMAFKVNLSPSMQKNYPPGSV